MAGDCRPPTACSEGAESGHGGRLGRRDQPRESLYGLGTVLRGQMCIPRCYLERFVAKQVSHGGDVDARHPHVARKRMTQIAWSGAIW